MEKRVSNLVNVMMNKQLFLILICTITFGFKAIAQNDVPIANSKEYTIAEIKVTGTSNYNEQTVIAFTGLREGDKIYIPGDRMSNVIKKLFLKFIIIIRCLILRASPFEGRCNSCSRSGQAVSHLQGG